MSRPSRLFQILTISVVAAGLPCDGESGKGVVQGRVTDAQGNPVSGATVQIARPGRSRGSANNTLPCNLGTGGEAGPQWVQNIPLGPCGDIPNAGKQPTASVSTVFMHDYLRVEREAWGNREVRDLHTTQTDSQGHYAMKAPGAAYEMAAFRLQSVIPDGFPYGGNAGPVAHTGPLAHGSVELKAGQTITQDLVLLEPTGRADASNPPRREDWPVVFEGPVAGGGSICLNVAALASHVSLMIELSFRPALLASEVSFETDGVRRPAGSRWAGSISGWQWAVTGAFDGSKPATILFRKPVTDAKVQAISYDPATGYGPSHSRPN